jgi:hypothetical protein
MNEPTPRAPVDQRKATIDIEPLLVGPKQAQAMLDIGSTTFFRLLKAGAFQTIKIGKARRISVASIRSFAANGMPPLK